MQRRQFLTLASLAALAACGGGRSGDRAPAVNRPRFDDADPVDWPGRSPSAYPVHGLDVSKYQGEIDWRAARAAGVSFAFIKATEGGDRVDDLFRAHWRAAGRAGVPRGAYHFWYHCRTASEQAAWFIANVPRTPGALPPVLDMEWTPFSPTCTIRRPADHIRTEARQFMDAVQAHYGQSPIVYTTVDFWEDNQMWLIPGNHEFWLRSTAAHPSDSYDGHHWTFWQYTGTGLVPGVSGRVDINAFRGSRADWADWLSRRAA